LPGAIPINIADDILDYDAYKLPDYKELDYIFSSHCLEHLHDPVKALEYWKEHIRKDGTLFLYLPHPDMAVECLKQIKTKKIEIVQGTGYHVNTQGIEAERLIAEEVGANFGIHTFVDINGFVFNLKHRTSRSIIPHGRMTGPARSKLWEVIWKETKGFPTSNLLVRGHVHYYQYYCSGMGAVMTLPCLKTLGDRYGASNYDDTIDYGFIHFEIDKDGNFNHRWYTPVFKREIPRVRKI